MTDMCGATSLRGAVCEKEKDHAGAHICVDANGVTGWPNYDPKEVQA